MRLASVLCAFFWAVPTLYAQISDIGAPPGTLINIGGRKLHIHCTGSGTPNVVLEAGAQAFAIDWALVQPEIACTNRICSYDRAGLGWSDPAPAEETPAFVVADLHVALEAAGVRPPYVMVGASMGAIYVRLYDTTYPGEVAGFVLVDPASEERLFTMLDGKGIKIASLTAEQLRSTIPPGPVTLPPREPQTGPPFDLLPGDLYKTRIMLEKRLIASIPTSVPHDTVVASAEGQRAALARLHGLSSSQDHPLADRPLVVLTRGIDSSQGLKDTHAALAQQSTNSRQIVVDGAGHEIHLFKAAAVVQSIRDVLDSVTSGKRLTEK